MKKGKSIYLKYKEQILISVALDHLLKYHQEKYEEECRLHEFDKCNIDNWHLDKMLDIRDILEDKILIKKSEV